jgi:hypothetical protein
MCSSTTRLWVSVHRKVRISTYSRKTRTTRGPKRLVKRVQLGDDAVLQPEPHVHPAAIRLIWSRCMFLVDDQTCVPRTVRRPVRSIGQRSDGGAEGADVGCEAVKGQTNQNRRGLSSYCKRNPLPHDVKDQDSEAASLVSLRCPISLDHYSPIGSPGVNRATGQDTCLPFGQVVLVAESKHSPWHIVLEYSMYSPS